MSKKYLGQAAQDFFVMNVLKYKPNGHFLEIGSADPINNNNSCLLEKYLNWKGIMVEYEDKWLPLYKEHRKNSVHYIQDATTIDFKKILEENTFPQNIDYLQIDLEVENNSTLSVLKHFDESVFPFYKFATVTFEHDIYRGDFFETRKLSREIFKKHGYICVFPDVSVSHKHYGGRIPFEDWYVHPDLVDMNYILKVRKTESLSYEVIEEILESA
jgi:hypothetical protein